MNTPRPKRYRSIFENLFLIQDGVISISLRNLTLYGCIIITGSLLGMLYMSCSNNYVSCSVDRLPMISDVIFLPLYDRIFCIETIFFTLFVHQANIRAFYKKLYGIADPCTLDLLTLLGVLSCFALPLIGLFDEHQFKSLHMVFAITFFGCTGIFAFISGGVM